MRASALEQDPVPQPRCAHGEIWNRCEVCRRYAWCEDCGEIVNVDEPLHPRETITCVACVDRMIGRGAWATGTVRPILGVSLETGKVKIQ